MGAPEMFTCVCFFMMFTSHFHWKGGKVEKNLRYSSVLCVWANYTLEPASSPDIEELFFLGTQFIVHESTVHCEVENLFQNYL